MTEPTDTPKHRMDVVHFDRLVDEITALGLRIQARKKEDPGWRPWVVVNQRIMFDDEMEDLVDAVARLNGRTVDEMISLMLARWIKEPDLWAMPELYIADPRWQMLPGLGAKVSEILEGA